VWVAGRIEALDHLLAPGYRDHDPPPGYGADVRAAHEFARAFVAGMRDTKLTILALIGTADQACAHYRLEWTHSGAFLGEPAAHGRRLRLRGCDLVRVADGRITDIHHVENVLGTLRQMSS
jgi:predicted ester cyclase